MMLVAGNLLMIALAAALAYFADLTTPSGMALIIPLVGAGQDAGKTYYKRQGELPSNGLSWLAAALFTALNTGLSALQFALLVGLMARLTNESLAIPPLPQGEKSLILGLIGGILLFILTVQFLAARFSFSSGAKQQAQKA